MPTRDPFQDFLYEREAAAACDKGILYLFVLSRVRFVSDSWLPYNLGHYFISTTRTSCLLQLRERDGETLYRVFFLCIVHGLS